MTCAFVVGCELKKYALMDDLAESVIRHLSVADGDGPCAAVCSLGQEYPKPCVYAIVVPATKGGILSFNIDFVQEPINISQGWQPYASFNVASASDASESLAFWQSSVCRDSVADLNIEIATWHGYPPAGVGRRCALPCLEGHRKAHANFEEVEKTLRLLGRMRAPVDA